jgi:hypothetical protein
MAPRIAGLGINSMRQLKRLTLLAGVLFILFPGFACEMSQQDDQQKMPSFDSQKANDEWKDFKDGKLGKRHSIRWVVSIKSKAHFGGGFYKGHIYGRKECRLHIVPQSAQEKVIGQLDSLKNQDYVMVSGQLIGVKRNGDVVIMVNQILLTDQ